MAQFCGNGNAKQAEIARAFGIPKVTVKRAAGRWTAAHDFIGASGTGKTHLVTGLCVAAWRQQKRARFIKAAGLVNELVEAQQQHLLGRALQRWTRLELIVLDEVG